MTGYEQDRELTITELELIKERIRQEPTLDPKELAKQIGVRHLTVSRTIKALLWLENERIQMKERRLNPETKE